MDQESFEVTLPNKPDTPNPAITSRFQVWSHWRGIGDPERSAERLLPRSGPIG